MRAISRAFFSLIWGRLVRNVSRSEATEAVGTEIVAVERSEADPASILRLLMGDLLGSFGHGEVECSVGHLLDLDGGHLELDPHVTAHQLRPRIVSITVCIGDLERP